MRRRVKRLRPSRVGAYRLHSEDAKARETLLASIEKARASGDVELEKDLLRLGRDQGLIESPGPHAEINDAIRRAHGRLVT